MNDKLLVIIANTISECNLHGELLNTRPIRGIERDITFYQTFVHSEEAVYLVNYWGDILFLDYKAGKANKILESN